MSIAQKPRPDRGHWDSRAEARSPRRGPRRLASPAPVLDRSPPASEGPPAGSEATAKPAAVAVTLFHPRVVPLWIGPLDSVRQYVGPTPQASAASVLATPIGQDKPVPPMPQYPLGFT